MKKLNVDVAFTVVATVPTDLATQYRTTALARGNVALAELSAQFPDDQEFIRRILSDNLKHGIARVLPGYLENGGFGIHIVPHVLQEAEVLDVQPRIRGATADLAAVDDLTEGA